MNHREAAFTLIELLVAITLMLILTGSVVFIFVQAQAIFGQTMALVEVYENARYAMDQMQRDLANAAKTADMEFYRDNTADEMGRGHFGTNNAEAYAVLQSDRTILQGLPYIYAPVVYQAEPWRDLRGVEHRQDSIYFRTVTQVGGQTRQALVAYFLHHEDPVTRQPLTNPVLQKQLATLDENGNVVIEDPIDLCEYVTDVEIRFFYANRARGQTGRYFTAREAIEPPGAGVSGPELPNWASTGYAVSTCVQSWDGTRSEGAGAVRLVSGENRFYIDNGQFDFGPMRPGDAIWIYPTQDTHRQAWRPRDLLIRGFGQDGTGRYVTFTAPFSLPTGVTNMPVEYRAGWLPSSVQIRLTIKDERSIERRTIEQVFKLLRA